VSTKILEKLVQLVLNVILTNAIAVRNVLLRVDWEDLVYITQDALQAYAIAIRNVITVLLVLLLLNALLASLAKKSL
jgi:hypothetical protein